MNVRQVQELRRSNAATPIPGKRYIPAIEWDDDAEVQEVQGQRVGDDQMHHLQGSRISKGEEMVRTVPDLQRREEAGHDLPGMQGSRLYQVVLRGGKSCEDAGGVCGPWDKQGTCKKCHEKTNVADPKRK